VVVGIDPDVRGSIAVLRVPAEVRALEEATGTRSGPTLWADGKDPPWLGEPEEEDSANPAREPLPWEGGGEGGAQEDGRGKALPWPLLPREACQLDPLTLPELVAKRDAFLRDGLLPAANAEGAVALDEASSRLTGYEALPKKELLLRTAARGMPAKGNRGDLAKRLLAWDLGVVVGGPSSAGTAVVEDVPVRVAGVDALVTLYDVPVQESVVGNTRRLRPDGGALVDVVRRISALSRASAAPADEGAGATGAPRPQLIAFVEEPQIIPRMTGAISGFWSGMYHGMYAGMFMMVDAVVVPVKPSSWKGDLRLFRGGKDASIRLAGVLAPQLRHAIHRDAHHGRAEAVLIALWGLRATRGVAQDGGGLDRR